MILEGEIKDDKQFFFWFPNTHSTLISFVFSLWLIITDFEKLLSLNCKEFYVYM